jgi:hypothetical protein
LRAKKGRAVKKPLAWGRPTAYSPAWLGDISAEVLGERSLAPISSEAICAPLKTQAKMADLFETSSRYANADRLIAPQE